MLLGCRLVQPQRVLHDGVRGEAAGVAVGAEKLVDGLERDLQPAQPERRVRARIQAKIHQLVVQQRDKFLRLRPNVLRDWA